MRQEENTYIAGCNLFGTTDFSFHQKDVELALLQKISYLSGTICNMLQRDMVGATGFYRKVV